MNLFLIGWSPAGGADAAQAERCLRSLVERLGFFDPERIERWRSPGGHAVLASVAHESERVGGVRHLHLESERMALFSGRPFRWTGEVEADGRGPLDARFYLRPSGEWMADLDGRFVAARYDDRQAQLEICADALGAYPVYWGQDHGTRWISNSAELIREALDTREVDVSVLASLFACGWSLSGHPVWKGVRRYARGVVVRLRAGGAQSETDLLPIEQIARLPGGGFDPQRAAALLVSASAALSDWPGRPTLLQLSGGRDSRLLLAAALAGGFEFEVVTAGAPEHPDVMAARLLCTAAGVSHRRLPADPTGALDSNAAQTARILSLTSGGAASLADAAGYFAAPEGALPLWLNGQGGEIGRAHYGTAPPPGRDGLVAWLLERVAGSGDILSAQGRALVESELGRAVDEALGGGAASRDVPDVFYALKRMAGWAATGHGCPEYVKGDTAAPLWSRRLIAQQLGPPACRRAREAFPMETLAQLSPGLARVPYAEDRSPSGGGDGFGAVQAQVREAARAHTQDPAWEALDRAGVERLLGRDPASLRSRERRSVWRLGTHFLSLEREAVA